MAAVRTRRPRIVRPVAYAVLAAAAVWMVPAAPAEAIPAFARRYQFSCSTCHAPVPRLTPFGETFAARGFRLADPSLEPPAATVDTGDPTLKLLREVPIAVRLDGFASVKDDVRAETDMEWPWAFKILSGGPLSDKISYYAYFIIERGEVAGLEDAYLQFNEPFKLPLNLLAGQFQVCDPLFKRELRLERFDYEIFRVRVGDSPINLAYDRGVVASTTIPGEVDTVFQVVNGNGIGHADVEESFDDDGLKNVSLRLSRTFDRVRLGVFSYWGRTSAGDTRNRTYYLGPDVAVTFSDRLHFNAEYLERRDDNPMFATVRPGEWKTRGGFAELVFLPRGVNGSLSLAALYNKIASDDPGAARETISGTIGHLLARNIRGVFEVGHDLERKAPRVSLGIVAAF